MIQRNSGVGIGAQPSNMAEWRPQESPAALRERARWYRDYATVCAGDNTWCLQLADRLDRMADEREKALSTKKKDSA